MAIEKMQPFAGASEPSNQRVQVNFWTHLPWSQGIFVRCTHCVAVRPFGRSVREALGRGGNGSELAGEAAKGSSPKRLYRYRLTKRASVTAGIRSPGQR